MTFKIRKLTTKCTNNKLRAFKVHCLGNVVIFDKIIFFTFQDDLNEMDPMSCWEFFSELLDSVSEMSSFDVMSDDELSTEGHVLLLDFVTTVLELDMTFFLQG